MAYSLRYWYNNKLNDGKVIRLEIYKKDSTAAAMEIGDVVQGISLNIDGGEDNIDAPIVSTSLVMTFCDAYDHPEADVKKCGNYAEFYTPDATLWKVVLLCKDKGSSSFRTLWGGYVTPDSYEEDLTYRGSVTIVARDNIGHMADFPFDAEGDDYGTISFREIIEGAWAKIESPMSLVFHDEWMQTEGVSALDTRMNVSAFEDKSWHEAVEAALYAYGAVLRFIGDNEVKVSPLRYMPNYGGSVTHSEPVFMTGATRMLTPAVKKIEETASYELESELQPLVKPSDFSGNNHALDAGNEIYGYSLSNTEEGKGWFNTTDYNAIYFDPSAYNILEADSVADIKNQMYIVANVGFNYKAEYSRYVSAHNAQIKISFGTGLMRKRYTDASGKPIGGYYLVPRAGKIMAASYSVSVTQNGVTQYLDADGEWTTTSVYKNFTDENGFSELNIPIDLSDYTGTILLKVEIGGLDATIPYVQIAALSFGANEKDPLLQTNRVNTNYNEDNNVIITRDPAIAPAYNTTFLPSVIKNGIFYAEGLAYKPAKAWAFDGDTPQQMAVYNHLQLLAYYAKPNNVIEGSIVNGDVSRFAHIWQFEGKEHILVSGRYNFINGYIEGAILREFARYESLWESTGGTQLPATETSSETNIEASASSSSSANTYENTTVVNIGTGGGGSGASYLGDLKDVDTTAVVGGSVLYFNGTQWVDKTLQMILNELKQLGDWFYKTEDGKSIGTKYNLFSEGEMSANGLNLGGGGSGSGGSTTLDGLIDVNLSSPQNGNILVFNGTHWVNKPQSELVPEVDLSDYYTKQQTQNAITSALSPYIKATDADGKYAALASFNALQSSFDRLYSALNDDTSGVINTWNEVVDFVNEYSGSEDLSTILGKMNTDINARVKVSDFDTWKTDVFNPLSTKVDTNTANINKILGWFNVDADGNLFTTYNFYSTKEISANGISQGTGGGGSGLISSVLGVGSLGATLTNDNSVVFNAYATNEIYKATQGHASRIGVLESQVGQLTTQSTKVSVSDLLTTGTKIATITVDGVAHEVKGDFLPTNGGTITGVFGALTIDRNDIYASAIKFSNSNGVLGYIGINDDYTPMIWSNDGTYTHTLIHSGNVKSVNGIFVSRGFLTSNNDLNTLLDVGAYSTQTSINQPTDFAGWYGDLINYRFPDSTNWQLFATNTLNTSLLFRKQSYNAWSDWKTLAFTSDLENYLPLSGGTISGLVHINVPDIAAAIEINTTSPQETGLHVYNNGEDKAWFGWHTDFGAYIYNSKNQKYLGIKDNGTPYYGDNALLHSGNIGEYALKTDGSNYMKGPLVLQDTTDISIVNNMGIFVGRSNKVGGAAFDYASFINIPDRGVSQLQLSWHRDYNNLKLVTRIYESNNWSDWKTLAFTDSNVASATKLQTASGILEDFTLYKAPTVYGIKLVNGDSSSRFGFYSYETGKYAAIVNTKNDIENCGLQLNDNGNIYIFGKNVGIGTINPAYKLDVNGDIASSGALRMGLNSAYGAYLQTNDEGGWTGIYSANKGNWQATNMYFMPNGDVRFAHAARVIGKNTDGDTGLFVEGTQYSIWFGIGSGNVNRGIFDINNNGWWIYRGSDTLTRISGGIETSTGSFTGAVTMSSTLTIAGATTHNGIAYFGSTTYYINTSGNAHFNAISGSSLQVDSAAFNGTIHSNEYSGSVAKWSITKDGAASFASLSNGGLLETSTLRVSSTSTFTGKTNHNGGIGATSLNVSGTSTLSGHVGIGISPHSTYALYVDGSLRCGPIDGGTASLGALYSNTHVPNSSETYNLGSDAYRWASIYGVGADFSGNVTVNGTLYANGTLYTNDIDGSNIYITASSNLYLTTTSGYFGAQNQIWAIDGYGNYKGQSLYINPRDNDNEIITDDNKKKTHGFPREGVAVFVNGDIAATGEISANALNQGSDIRFKHQLGDITLDLDTIANAPMFRFTWTNKENSRVQIGTSAQYWKDYAKELVTVDNKDFHRLDYATLGVLIGVTLGKTVKNHEDRIKELETKVESLEAENRRLRYGN